MVSSIDDVEMDADIDGDGHTVVTLILHGDFTTACEDHLDDNTGTLRLRITQKIAQDLVTEVGRYV
jgi:hypothetical protein